MHSSSSFLTWPNYIKVVRQRIRCIVMHRTVAVELIQFVVYSNATVVPGKDQQQRSCIVFFYRTLQASAVTTYLSYVYEHG